MTKNKKTKIKKIVKKLKNEAAEDTLSAVKVNSVEPLTLSKIESVTAKTKAKKPKKIKGGLSNGQKEKAKEDIKKDASGVSGGNGKAPGGGKSGEAKGNGIFPWEW